jgi:hypothetical protein
MMMTSNLSTNMNGMRGMFLAGTGTLHGTNGETARTRSFTCTALYGEFAKLNVIPPKEEVSSNS